MSSRKKRNKKIKTTGKAWLRKTGYNYGLKDYNPNYYRKYASFMNNYRKGQMHRLLEGKIT